MKLTSRRTFIKAAAAAPLVGATGAAQAETDSIKAAVQALRHEIGKTVPAGFKMGPDVCTVGSSVIALAFPSGVKPEDWKTGDAAARYNSAKGGWKITA